MRFGAILFDGCVIVVFIINVMGMRYYLSCLLASRRCFADRDVIALEKCNASLVFVYYSRGYCLPLSSACHALKHRIFLTRHMWRNIYLIVVRRRDESSDDTWRRVVMNGGLEEQVYSMYVWKQQRPVQQEQELWRILQ